MTNGIIRRLTDSRDVIREGELRIKDDAKIVDRSGWMDHMTGK